MEESDEALITKPSFLEYYILSMARGARVRAVKLKDFKFKKWCTAVVIAKAGIK